LNVYIKAIRNWLGFIILILVAIGFYVEIGETTPDNAKVFISHSKKEYTSPPCVENGISDALLFNTISTKAEANELDYSPEKNCRNQRPGGFTNSKYLITEILEYIGLLSEKTRWSEQGDWYY